MCKSHAHNMQRLRKKSFLCICGVRAAEILKDLFLYIAERLHKDCIEEKSKAFHNYGVFSNGKNKSFNKKLEKMWGSLPVSLVRLEIFCSTFYMDDFFLKFLSVQNIRSPELAIVSPVSLKLWSWSCKLSCCTYLFHVYSSLPCMLSSLQTLKKNGATSQDLVHWEKMTEVKRPTICNLDLRIILHSGKFLSIWAILRGFHVVKRVIYYYFMPPLYFQGKKKNSSITKNPSPMYRSVQFTVNNPVEMRL